MHIEVKIIDDNGDVLAEHKADASQPSMWRAPSGSRFVSDMPRNSDQPATGTYEIFGITFQPHVRMDRPNGYIAPPSIPFTGNFPGSNVLIGSSPLSSYPSSLSGPIGLSKG